jgi:exportin-T
LHARMKYPIDFVFDYEDEEESEEEVYRDSLRKIYQRIVRLRPQIVLSFISQCFASLPQSLAQSATADIECALRLVYHYGEGRRPTPGAKSALMDGQFRQIILALHRSDVSSHPHREVIMLYYDICVRYSAILKESPDLLTLLVGSLLSNRGLQHAHIRVRCRCCYQLLRLIKSIGAMAMRPHIEAVVDGIQVLLFPALQQGTPFIPADEALYLFETTGILLGTSGLDADVQVKCITAVLTPHIRSIEQSLECLDLSQNVEILGDQFSMSISAIAQLSKGWQKCPPPGVRAVFMAAIGVCLNVLETLPSCSLVRNRIAVLLQRMILCTGEQILPEVPSFFRILLSFCTIEEDILDVSQLINQLCIKFREKATDSIDSTMLPFLQKVLSIQNGGRDMESDNGIAPPPHLISEQLSIRKLAFSTLQHIAVYNVSEVFYSKSNVASLGNVLQLMNDGAISVPDPVMNKTCVQFFCALIHQWRCSNDNQSVGPPIQVNNAFFDFVYDTFVPGMLSAIIDANSFNVKDATHRRVLAEFGVALWSLKQSHRGNAEFQARVIDSRIREGEVGGRKGCPEIANALLDAKSGKDIELILKKWKEATDTMVK